VLELVEFTAKTKICVYLGPAYKKIRKKQYTLSRISSMPQAFLGKKKNRDKRSEHKLI
jgi:hypothetical protein